MEKSIIILTLLLYAYNVQGQLRVDPLVETKLGLIRGIRDTSGGYSMFMGIPYATVDPENPFGPSAPFPNFDTVFEAYDDSAICPQVEEFNNTIVGTLDCLHLNVYVPNSASSQNRLPVLVWIHGGGFSIGFAGRYLYGPSYLVRHDVILVTLNYRLGPYGFMCLDTPNVPGNQGLKDQVLALQWVKENIESFGGDSDSITIYGQSAGGASVDFHLLYGNENLFNKVIMSSGTSFGPWVMSEPDREAPQKIAAYLGYDTDTQENALSFLATANANLVIAAVNEMGMSFRACVEIEYDGVTSFITEHPLNIERSSKKVPMIIGHNDDERVVSYVNEPEEYFQRWNEIYESLNTNFNFDQDELREMVSLVRHFYFGDNDITRDVVANVIDYSSDFMFNYPVHRSIDRYIQDGYENIFHYIFAYTGDINFVKKRFNVTEGGVSHSDDISYLFHVSYESATPSSEDQLIIDRMTTIWANFVKYGNPTPETSELLPVKWEPVTEHIRYYLNIDSEVALMKRPFYSRMTFWDLFYKLNERKEKHYRDNGNM